MTKLIRRGNEEFDSVTFVVESVPEPLPHPARRRTRSVKKPRFWVRLADANRIDCEVVE